MASEKGQFLGWLYRQSFDQDVLDFSSVLIDGAMAALGLSRINAEAFAVGSIRRIWNAVIKEQDLDKKRGLAPQFEILTTPGYKIRWIPRKWASSPDPRLRQVGIRGLSRPAILRAMDTLSSREYEALACTICQLIGCSSVTLTPPGNEGGVDFFAIMGLPGGCHLLSGSTGPLRLVGQAKQYSTPVDVGRVRDFITSLDNVRKRHYTVEDHVPAWFRSAPGPVVGWMVAQEGMQSGAEKLARDHGIIMADSIDLAEMAALSRKLDTSLRPQERANALVAATRAFLKQYKPATA